MITLNENELSLVQGGETIEEFELQAYINSQNRFNQYTQQQQNPSPWANPNGQQNVPSGYENFY